MMEQVIHRSAALLTGYGTLVFLGVVELVTPYDVLERRVALFLTNLSGIVLLWILQRSLEKHGHHLPVIVQWSVIAGIAFDAAGNFLRLYGSILWWDRLAHTVGSAAVALALYALIREFRASIPFAESERWTSLFVLGTTSVLAMLYEISEYIGDLAFQTHRVTDLYDTADDLMWNLLGSAAVLILIHVIRTIRRVRPL